MKEKYTDFEGLMQKFDNYAKCQSRRSSLCFTPRKNSNNANADDITEHTDQYMFDHIPEQVQVTDHKTKK